MHIWKFSFQGLKVRIQPELSAIVARTSQLLLERYTYKCDIVIPLTLSDIRIDYILQLQRNHYQLYIYQYVLVMYAAINFNEFCRQPLLSNVYHKATQKCSMIIVD